MGFVQIIEYETSRADEVESLMERWMEQTEATRTAQRSLTCRDRERGNVYAAIVEFPSYEEAMRNSGLPETSEFAEQFSKLCDAGPTFRNLDVVRTEGL